MMILFNSRSPRENISAYIFHFRKLYYLEVIQNYNRKLNSICCLIPSQIYCNKLLYLKGYPLVLNLNRQDMTSNLHMVLNLGQQSYIPDRQHKHFCLPNSEFHFLIPIRSLDPSLDPPFLPHDYKLMKRELEIGLAEMFSFYEQNSS